jgi:glycosyltransferase involved in cell wall biosynthesis
MRLSPLLPVRVGRALLADLSAQGGSPPGRPRQLLADVSVISRSDAGTGIQRVVRELLRQWLRDPPPGYEVRPVHAGRWTGFRHAARYRAALAGGDWAAEPSGPVRVSAGDVFLGMDLAARTLPHHHALLARWKASGVRMHFIVYDLLPVLRPDWFTPSLVAAYRRWLRTVSLFADGLECISRSVADELTRWLADQYGGGAPLDVPVRWFHLGADWPRGAPLGAVPIPEPDARTGPRSAPLVLMVGTVEVRKGYAQALAAFERLWSLGRDLRLAIVGREGWKVDGLVRRLRAHPEAGSRLLWLENASDDDVAKLYRAADGLLMASEGEGFGLPIIEAAQYGVPVLARDLPVFREIAGDGAAYFSGDSADELAARLEAWLSAPPADPRKCGAIPVQSWADSARQLLSRIEGT